jgi:hypothetical protein
MQNLTIRREKTSNANSRQRRLTAHFHTAKFFSLSSPKEERAGVRRPFY